MANGYSLSWFLYFLFGASAAVVHLAALRAAPARRTRREAAGADPHPPEPVSLGGQERQTVLNVRTMDRTRLEPLVAVLHVDGDHLADLEAAGVRPVVFDVGRSLLRPGTAWQLAGWCGSCATSGMAVIHAQDVYTNVLGTLAARLAGVPVIVTRVDLGHHLAGYRRPLLVLASRRADRVLVNALCIRDLAIRDGVEADRVAVVRNGVDLEELEARGPSPARCRRPRSPAPSCASPTCTIR